VVEAAIARLDAEFDLFDASPIILNKAIGGAGRDFANAVALVESRLEPKAILAEMKAVERDFGRRRGKRWGTRVLDLDPTSVEANRNWFGGEHAPSRGVTVGLGTILAARRVLLLAFGREKAPAVARMVKSPPGPDCPASFLGKRDALVILDRQAAKLLDPVDR